MPSTELADLNLLFAAVNADHVDHDTARAWLSTVARFATTPLTESGLVRLLMNGTVMEHPASIEVAISVLHSLRGLRNATFVPDSTSLADSRAVTNHVRGTKQVVDTHLLNLAIANGYVLTTFDRGLRDALTHRHRRHVRVLDERPEPDAP